MWFFSSARGTYSFLSFYERMSISLVTSKERKQQPSVQRSVEQLSCKQSSCNTTGTISSHSERN